MVRRKEALVVKKRVDEKKSGRKEKSGGEPLHQGVEKNNKKKTRDSLAVKGWRVFFSPKKCSTYFPENKNATQQKWQKKVIAKRNLNS